MINYIKRDFALIRTYWHDILMAITALMAALILILGILNFNHSQSNNSQQLAQIKTLSQQIKSLAQQNLSESNVASDQSKQQLLVLSQELQCIGDFFAQTNRTNLVINNLNACTLSASSSGGATGSTKSGVNNVTRPTTTHHNGGATTNNGSKSGNGGSGSPPKQSIIQRFFNRAKGIL